MDPHCRWDHRRSGRCRPVLWAVWARIIVAVVLAAVSIVVNFLWLPYYPVWAALIITVRPVS